MTRRTFTRTWDGHGWIKIAPAELVTTRQGNYMSIKMIANGKARDMVDERKPFRGSNIWAEWGQNAYDNKLYVVYSYRYTWPLFVYDEVADTWYENDTQFSQTTSRHRTQCRPSTSPTIKAPCDDMRLLAVSGSVGLIERMNKGEE